jgi:hypothetical protein
VLCLALAAVAPAAGGIEESTREDLSTEFEVEGVDGEFTPVEVRKRFRFSGDPGAADRVTVEEAALEILTPEGADFAFIESLEVYAVDLQTEARTLVAWSGDFVPGASRVELVVDDVIDLRRFVYSERISLVFLARPSRWFTGWPEGGYHIRASVTLLIDLL